jgi:hypothetical protein
VAAEKQRMLLNSDWRIDTVTKPVWICLKTSQCNKLEKPEPDQLRGLSHEPGKLRQDPIFFFLNVVFLVPLFFIFFS